MGVEVLPQALCHELTFSWKSCHLKIHTKWTYRFIPALGGVPGSRIVSQRTSQMPSVAPSSGGNALLHIFSVGSPKLSWLPIADGIRVNGFGVAFKICCELKVI